MIGKIFSHYRIIEKLAGGMGRRHLDCQSSIEVLCDIFSGGVQGTPAREL